MINLVVALWELKTKTQLLMLPKEFQDNPKRLRELRNTDNIRDYIEELKFSRLN